MAEGLGYARRKLINIIVGENWNTDKPEEKKFTFNELLFVIQEMLEEEGKKYFDTRTSRAGHHIFREFVKLILYRNLANYDSMVLITSEKGCITDDSLIEMPRDLKKYPKGIPVKKLIDKGPIYVYSLNNKTKKLEVKKSDGVEFAKYADVYEVELTNGMKIQATEDHPFLLTNGTYKQLKDLVWNAHLVKSGKTKGQIIYNRKGAKYTDRLQMVIRFGDSLNNDNFRIHYGIKPMLNANKKCQKEHKFIYEQLNGKIPEGYLVHHNNGKHYDNNIENLNCVSYSKHAKIHTNQNLNNVGKYIGYTRPKCLTRNGSEACRIAHSKQRVEFLFNPKNKDKVKKFLDNAKKIRVESSKLQNGGIIKCIRYIGKKNVYDVVNVRDNKNFIANGFVVSNTGKSSAAIMLAREWCKLLGKKFDPKRHIAYNNADVMTKIDLLQKFEPIVADESIRFACIEGNTKIKTEDGNICIKDLEGKENFKVYSFNKKTQKEELQIAEKCIKVREDEVFELITEDGKKIQATKDHNFLTTNGWKKLSELKEGENIIGI